MKKCYVTFVLSLYALFTFSQGYEFGIVQVSDYSFKIVAIPDFDSGGNTDISDVGFTLMLPAGSVDIINPSGLLGGRNWDVDQFDAATLSGLGGDGTEDGFLFNLPPGQTIIAHTNGQLIDLVSFDVSNTPVSGQLRFLSNSETIAMNVSGALDSFYNSNVDATTTQNYFMGIAVGMENFDFSLLGVYDSKFELNDVFIYPNPTSQYLIIKSKVTIEKIELFNILGKKVVSTSETSKLNVSHLEAGLYLLKLYAENTSLTKRVMIK